MKPGSASLKLLAARSFHAKRDAPGPTKSEADLQTTQPVVGEGYSVFSHVWERSELLARGQFGSVYRIYCKGRVEEMAVKQVEIVSDAMLHQMVEEVMLSGRAAFRNDNVVKCFGWSVTSNAESTESLVVLFLFFF